MLGVVCMTMRQPRLGYGYTLFPRHQLLCSGCISRSVGWRNRYHVVSPLGGTSSSACHRTEMLVDRNMDLFSRVYADPLELVHWVRDIGGQLGHVHLEGECRPQRNLSLRFSSLAIDFQSCTSITQFSPSDRLLCIELLSYTSLSDVFTSPSLTTCFFNLVLVSK